MSVKKEQINQNNVLIRKLVTVFSSFFFTRLSLKGFVRR